MALVSGAALHRSVAGMNALSGQVRPLHDAAGLALLVRGLYAPASASEFALGFAVMAMMGLVVGAITAVPVSSMLSRAR
jgi:hypothetical protein